MLVENLNDANEATLLRLKAEAARETQTLDFKGIPHKTNEKAELAKDICAFANADGGDIVIGVSSKNYVANGIVPITSEAFDALERRYLETINSWVEPRLSVRLVPIPLTAGGYAAVVRVAPSINGPHWIRLTEEQRRFVIRNGAKTDDMTHEQVRAAFDRTATLADRATAFIDERYRKIPPATLKSGQVAPMFVVHLVPISGLAGRFSADIQAAHRDKLLLQFNDWNTLRREFNYEGLRGMSTINSLDQRLHGYLQLFRNGSFEAMRRVDMDSDAGVEECAIHALSISKFCREAVTRVFDLSIQIGLQGPAILRCALLSMQSRGFVIDHTTPPKSTRRVCVLPEVWVQDISNPGSIDTLVCSNLDVLWQAFGQPACLDYTETGVWSPRG